MGAIEYAIGKVLGSVVWLSGHSPLIQRMGFSHYLFNPLPTFAEHRAQWLSLLHSHYLPVQNEELSSYNTWLLLTDADYRVQSF